MPNFSRNALVMMLVVPAVLVVIFPPKLSEAAAAKNVILMIADGQSINTIQATEYYNGSPAVYQAFPVQYGMSTYSSNNPAGYDPVQMWNDFDYAKSGATDSAAAATAMYTGEKTYNGQISWSNSGDPMTTIAEIADASGKATGVVTTVQISHATPAAVWAHNSSRNNYSAIAQEMIYSSGLDVIMGAGHPEYDNNGQAATLTDQYVGGAAAWADVKAGTANGFGFVESKSDFEALADGTYAGGVLPSKVIGIAQVNTTLQQKRSASSMNSNVPTLATMTSAAINVLDEDTDGFFLMVEGGAVDWANHANQLDRMIQEELDFNNAVASVVDWVDANSSWAETLLVVTADHETGYLWGPGSGTPNTFNHVVDNDPGELPGATHYYGSHSNSLVPLFSKGVGSDLFAGYATGTDTQLSAWWGLPGDSYLDNTNVFDVMNSAIIPEPSMLTLTVFCAMGFGLTSGRQRFPRPSGGACRHRRRG